MQIRMSAAFALIFFSLMSGCSLYSYTNRPKFNNGSAQGSQAQFTVPRDRKDHNANGQKTLVILSLSGGGSRAAYFSSSVMLQMEKVLKPDLNLLKEVDIISSVSGGSLPAAYYAVSQDSDSELERAPSGRIWNENEVKDLMSKNYIQRWFGNWFWPNNVLKYWFTAFDRSDIMAQTFADNLFDISTFGIDFGHDLTFADLNSERPYLVINATDATTDRFGRAFTFTEDDFIEIKSDINKYEIARAVMASASFPAVFNYMTLRDYRDRRYEEYVHVFDGGNRDNIGIESVLKIIDKNKSYEQVIVILVDAATETPGIDNDLYDPREGQDYLVDLNFIDSVDMLLKLNRKNQIEKLEEKIEALKKEEKKEAIFYHIKFEEIKEGKLNERLNRIKTDFKIKKEDAKAIDKAVEQLIVPENDCLIEIKKMLLEGEGARQEQGACTWSPPAKSEPVKQVSTK